MRLALPLVLAAMLAQAAAAQIIPRTPHGKPDFHGNWHSPWTTTLERGAGFTTPSVPLSERARISADFVARLEQTDPLGASFIWDLAGPLTIGGEIRTSLIVDPPDGRLPYTAEGQRRRTAFRPFTGDENAEQRGLNERCLMAGSGYAPFMTIPASNLRQIVQTDGHIVFLTESFGQLRLIPMDGSAGPVIPRGGSSKGRWDGDTLVIETAITAEADRFRSAPMSTFAISPATRITERFTLSGPDEILYRFTVEDASLYIRPWTAESVLRRSTDRWFEWACHEGNYSMANILRGARLTEQKAFQGSRQTLSAASPAKAGVQGRE